MKHLEQKQDSVLFGLWVYILSDCVLFAALFATYAVQQHATFGGPDIGSIVNLPFVLVETLLLLTSSFVCGLAVLAGYKNKKNLTLAALGGTLLFGLAFVAMELYEFGGLLTDGHSWQQSGFLSSFFTLVGTHGLHVTLGMVWLAALIVSISLRGVGPHNMRKLLAFSLFWHFLDIMWIFIFTFVYLIGA